MEAEVRSSQFFKEAARNASKFDYHSFRNDSVKRQLMSITDIGTDALKEEKKIKRVFHING